MIAPPLDVERTITSRGADGSRPITHDQDCAEAQIADADKRDLLAAGQVFAMPSRADTFGIAYLEAWAYGVPVIGADAGGIPDVIAHGEDGLIVPFGDVDALATSIGRLLDDPALRDRLGSHGKHKTLSRWTWDALFGDIRALYVGV